MRIVVSPLVIMWIIMGCTRTVFWDAPPDVRFATESSQLSGSDNAKQWWRTYKLAARQKTQEPEKACRNFRNLAEQKGFPLKKLAEFQAIQFCSMIGEKVIVRPNFESHPRWMTPTVLDAKISYTSRFEDIQTLAPLLIQKSKLALPKEQKVALVQQALEISQGEEKERWQKRLYKLAPRLTPSPTASQWMEVARDFEFQRQFKKARDYYQKIINSRRTPFEQKLKAQGRLAKTWRLQRDDQRFLEELIEMQKLARTQLVRKQQRYIDSYHDISVKVARRYWTLGNVSAARKELRTLKKRLKGKHSLAKIEWLQGRMEEERGRHHAAIEHFQKAVASVYRKDTKEEYLWYLGWNLRKVKNHTGAIEAFEQILDGDNYDAKVGYWRARTLLDSGAKKEAQQAFLELIEKDPVGYYGQLGHRELKLPLPALVSQKKPHFPTLNSNELVVLDWLVSVGEYDLAQEYIKDLKKEHPQLTRMEKLQLKARSGIYLPLFAKLSQLPPDEQRQLLSDQPDLFFPMPYNDAVRAASARFEVDAALIYSIMRQESAFNPEARSPADAFGLMQLLESVAKRHARKQKRTVAHFNELYEPQKNIELGASLLQTLFRSQGAFIPAVASYNASPRAIRGWISTRYSADSTEFIEDIPYQETRKYVKLVMRNYVFYLQRTATTSAIFFPEWCLNSLSPSKS